MIYWSRSISGSESCELTSLTRIMERLAKKASKRPSSASCSAHAAPSLASRAVWMNIWEAAVHRQGAFV
jgi:hypothetical protein